MWTPPGFSNQKLQDNVNQGMQQCYADTQTTTSGVLQSFASTSADFQSQWSEDFYLTPDEDGDLPLHIAIVKEDINSVHTTIQTMLQRGQSLDVFNNLRQTPLHLAVTTNNATIVRMLLNNGADMSAVDNHGDSALHLAIKCGARECLLLMVEHPQAEKIISSLNYEGLAPLHLAVLKNDANSIKLLISTNADVDIVDGKSGRTPLFLAVENNLIHMVELLVSLGASVNLANFSSITPLIAATDRGNKIITSILISRGAMISSKYDY